MQKLILASLAALASVEASTPFSKVLGNSWMNGNMFETKEGEAGSEKVTLQFDWVNACDNKNDKWEDGAWIQNYAYWQTKEPGVYRSVSCAAQYFNRENNFSPYRIIANYEGAAINSVNENPMAYSHLTEAHYSRFEEVADENAGYYQTWKKKELAQQNCSAVATIYSATDGVVDSQEVSDFYWQLKNAATLSIGTGFRTWNDQTSTSTMRQGEVGVEFSFTDFGIELIVPDTTPIVDEAVCLDENCEVEEEVDTIFGIRKIYVFIGAALLVIILLLIIICCCCFKSGKEGSASSISFGKDPEKTPVKVGKRSQAGAREVELADKGATIDNKV